MQIMTSRSLFYTSFILLTLTTGRHASGQNYHSSLEYSKDSTLGYASVPLVGPNRARYTLRLIPENDTHHHVVVLTLALTRRDDQGLKSNLLEPPGRWHGYQPYIFAASDFAQSVNGPLGKHMRTIDLPKLDMQIEVTIVGVKIERTSLATSGEIPYQFADLTLEITTKSR